MRSLSIRSTGIAKTGHDHPTNVRQSFINICLAIPAEPKLSQLPTKTQTSTPFSWETFFPSNILLGNFLDKKRRYV
jgi:hypothetical protein